MARNRMNYYGDLEWHAARERDHLGHISTVGTEGGHGQPAIIEPDGVCHCESPNRVPIVFFGVTFNENHECRFCHRPFLDEMSVA